MNKNVPIVLILFQYQVKKLSPQHLMLAFFWQGGSLKKKYHFVKWSKICLPKKKGGLGIEDLRKKNISLFMHVVVEVRKWGRPLAGYCEKNICPKPVHIKLILQRGLIY